MPMLSRQSESKQKWRGPELNISGDYSRSLSSYSSSSEPQTPSPLDGSFNGLLLFDTMDFKNLRNSFNLYDCCKEVEEHTTKQRRVTPRKFRKSNKKNNNLYMMKSQEDLLFNSPPKSILVCPEENFTVIPNADLERPQPVQKQRERAASVTTPPPNRLSNGRTRSNTICVNKTQSEDNRRNRLNSTESESSDCAYCKSIGREHFGHTKQKCPRIGLLEPCKLCGATGYDNHTVTHCPSSSKVYLKLDPSFSERLMRAQRARGAVCEVQ